MFHDILRKLSEGADIELERDGEQGRLHHLRGGRVLAPDTAPDDFPALSVDDLGHSFTLSAADLKRLIEKTRFAISTEETRYYLTGSISMRSRAGEADAAGGGHRRA